MRDEIADARRHGAETEKGARDEWIRVAAEIKKKEEREDRGRR